MSRRKLSPRDLAALNRGVPVGVRYPPNGGRGELRVPTKRQRRRQRRRYVVEILLDFFPAGPVLHIDGVKTLICWERLMLAQLVED